MRPHGLIVIFCNGVLGNGIKTVAYVFMFQEKQNNARKMMTCGAMIEVFKNSRAEGINELSYIIMFVYYVMYIKRVWINWQGLLLVTFRTWVRAPGPHPLSHYFSINSSMLLMS